MQRPRYQGKTLYRCAVGTKSLLGEGVSKPCSESLLLGKWGLPVPTPLSVHRLHTFVSVVVSADLAEQAVNRERTILMLYLQMGNQGSER